MNRASLWLVSLSMVACSRAPTPSSTRTTTLATDGASATTSSTGKTTHGRFTLPLVLDADVDLPGKPVRFDYQAFDVGKGHLIIAHMDDASVVVASTTNGAVVKVLTNIPTPRGVAVADQVGRIFVTSLPNRLVIIDNDSLDEIARVDTGLGPDGVAFDSAHAMVGVSDQRDGAVSLIAAAGSGARRQVPLGRETGNIVFDAGRGLFWVTATLSAPPDQLIAIDPIAAKATVHIALPGCVGAHGLRLHPDGRSAFVACETNAKILRVDLGGAKTLDLAESGEDPDVLAIDEGLGWLYVAAESGDLRVFDIGSPGLVPIDREHLGNRSHSIAVDPATHRVFFPLAAGPNGTPILRIMKPSAG